MNRTSRLDETLFVPTKLGRLCCAVVGTGALGSEIARLLGQLGLGRVLLIDPDTISACNLAHSIFFRGDARPGEPKVAAIARAGAHLFPSTTWNAVQREIADVPLDTLAQADLVFICPDTPVARAEAAHGVRRVAKPSIDAALMGESWWRGRVALFPAALEAACYLCQFSDQARSALLTHTASSAPGCSTRPAVAEFASTPLMASSIAALAVDTGLRHLLDPAAKASTSHAASALELTLTGAATRLETHTITRGVTCPWHEPSLRSSLRVLQGTASATVADLLEEHDATCLNLEWPLVTRARCLACGDESAPFARVATFRAGSTCTVCGAVHLLPLETVAEIHRDSRQATQTLEDLGLSSPCLASVR